MKSFTGIVQKGAQRGTELGYPTVNISYTDSDVFGIYAARVHIKDEAPYMAAAFADPAQKLLEAYILDFSDDLYGLEVTIELIEKIRESAKFDSDVLLREAIEGDVQKVRAYFEK